LNEEIETRLDGVKVEEPLTGRFRTNSTFVYVTINVTEIPDDKITLKTPGTRPTARGLAARILPAVGASDEWAAPEFFSR
jgi:hypothetical protein